MTTFFYYLAIFNEKDPIINLVDASLWDMNMAVFPFTSWLYRSYTLTLGYGVQSGSRFVKYVTMGASRYMAPSQYKPLILAS